MATQKKIPKKEKNKPKMVDKLFPMCYTYIKLRE